MAILQQPTNTKNPFADQIGDQLTPAGTHTATLIDIKDEFGVKRLKYQSTETETVDLTCFLFGFRDLHHQPHFVASRQMKISGNEKSALYTFLKSMLGRAPAYGWDYCALKGHKCLLTVEHVQKRDGSGVYAAISSLSPLPQSMAQGEAPTVPTPPQAQGAPQATVTPPPAQPMPAPVPTAAPAEDEIPF
jgi:hypothetical protein